MPKQFLFRGTTIGYKGNSASLLLPRTCTSINPLKALWFALECRNYSINNAVVYLFDVQNLNNIETSQNFLGELESEVALTIKPEDFYPLCEGFIHTGDFQKIMTTFGFDTYYNVKKDTLSHLCEHTPSFDTATINAIIDEMRIYLKK